MHGRGNRRNNRNGLSDQSPVSAALRALQVAYNEVDSRKSEAYRRGMLPDSPTLIEHGPLRVLVSSTPTPETMPDYIKTLTVNNVTHVVRVCEELYPSDMLESEGFILHDWFFPDGDPPPPGVVDKWLSLLDRLIHLSDYANSYTSTFFEDDNSESDAMTAPSPGSSADLPRPTVAVHCAAGLGRSPALVAVALVELGLAPVEAVGWLRALRRGAINAQQCAFLYNYQCRPPPTAVVKKPRNRVRSALTVASQWSSRLAARSLRSRSPSASRDSAPNSPLGSNVSPPLPKRSRASFSFSQM